MKHKVMDWRFSFTPNDILDLTRRELQNKVNPKIVLTIRVGKGFIGAGMPILLEDMAFSGKIQLRFKLMSQFPHVKTVEASFLTEPIFDFVLKPIGGDTLGFDISHVSFICGGECWLLCDGCKDFRHPFFVQLLCLEQSLNLLLYMYS